MSKKIQGNKSDRSDKSDKLNFTPEVCREMYDALSEAVEKYGKPGGPWNVPGSRGSWIEKAKKALKKARGEE